MKQGARPARGWIVLALSLMAVLGAAAPATAQGLMEPSSVAVASRSAQPLQDQTETTSADSPDAGESSLLKDLLGGGILVGILAAALIGFARSTRRFQS